MKKIIPDIIRHLKSNNFYAIQDIINNYNKEHSNDKYIEKYKLLRIGNSVIENTNDIPGLYYVENFLSKDELNSLNKIINDDIHFSSITSSSNSRRVAHFGYHYSYDRSGLKEAQCIPDELAKIVSPERINSILRKKLLEKDFDQLIINEYKPGQKIAYHTDHTKQFGSIIACITIGQSVKINFKNENQIKQITPINGSLYIMTDESRYNWKHSLCNDGYNNRYSLTYRYVNQK